MSDDIKQIAALIGHHQALEKRVTSLTEQFQDASAQLQQQSDTLSRLIRELDSASGNMTETVRQSVHAALIQVEKELKQAGLAQQKPATEALNQATDTAKAMIHEMRREMSRYTWKSAIYLVLTLFFVLASCVAALTWFMNDGYGQIAQMEAKKAEWERKAPLANISTCDGKVCVQVTGSEYTNKQGDRFYIIRQ
ncbi:mobilization protein MobX (plasmid) [Enterobacter hormaechei]|uniref:Mobilization protein MobX n=1 Tax=Citrobacter pasteurii TaxID=1563222 RepID=A0A6N6K004_9ENTR|nr:MULTISPECIES: mobilization protein MobX [Enterobacteriaceae]WIJ56182.1 mobilization protein MobX [Enterobacter hormaechei]HCQ8180028.1 mobilization protein MobX [Morganella morganii]KAA1274200.1 mobilization protein MobX [Citrobacter pasteurii]KJM92865.1 tRNA modification GTPase [Enterobacter hormaechei subsp. xiangfangensis]UBX47211.1 mobilization protein MobX [Citrobacter werkmanii]